MAKARQMACDDPGADPQEWLSEVLRVRIDEVVYHCPAALNADDIKGVHDMRVAMRRLRTVLRDFEEIIDKLPIKRGRKRLKRLSDLLGFVRDQDAAIIAFEKFSAKAENERIKPGMVTLIEEHRKLRRRAHVNLSKTFPIESVERLRETFEKAIDTARREPDLFRPATVTAAAREVISARLADLCELGNAIYDPYASEDLHKLRIRSKRLRYAIELFAACLGDAMFPFAAEVAKLQSSLGEVHDCDVWIEDLSKRMKKYGDTAKNSGKREAAVWLLSKFVKKRTKEYRAALELWSEWQANDFTEKLRVAISRP